MRRLVSHRHALAVLVLITAPLGATMSPAAPGDLPLSIGEGGSGDRTTPPSLPSSLERSASAITEGYPWPMSVVQGDSVAFYVSTPATTFRVDVYRMTADSVLVASLPGISGGIQSLPDSAYANGCGWNASCRLRIPPAWPSGVYTAQLVPSDGSAPGALIFVVRAAHPGASAGILVKLCTNTYQAYNTWGGKCLYDDRSVDGHRSFRVSMKRPYAQPYPEGEFPWREKHFIRWLIRHGYNAEFCTDVDINNDPSLDDNYRLLVSVGHDEYWSAGERDNVTARIASGQHVAFLCGNTCWWHVRYTTGLDGIICYKSQARDPYYGVDWRLCTENWFDDPLWDPENSMTGVSFRNGGYVNNLGFFPASEGWGGYTACNTGSWLYAGTGLHDGDEFGQREAIVGGEVDGALFYWMNGRPVVIGRWGTPLNYTVLAYAPASDGYATMGFYMHPSGGFVFNAATVCWFMGSRITANLIDHTAGAATSVPPVLPPAMTVSPSPSGADVLIALDAPLGGTPEIAIYDVGGALVARVPAVVSGSSTLARWNGTKAAGGRAAPGVYFAVAQSSGGRLSEKFLLEK